MRHQSFDAHRERNTNREIICTHGQYAVTEITKLNGVKPSFNAYDLIIRGHTGMIVEGNPEQDQLEQLALQFNGPAAVKDIGHELLRASHIVIPLEAIDVLEDVTGQKYTGTRRIENPLNHSTPYRNKVVTYPSNVSVVTDEFDDDDEGLTVSV